MPPQEPHEPFAEQVPLSPVPVHAWPTATQVCVANLPPSGVIGMQQPLLSHTFPAQQGCPAAPQAALVLDPPAPPEATLASAPLLPAPPPLPPAPLPPLPTTPLPALPPDAVAPAPPVPGVLLLLLPQPSSHRAIMPAAAAAYVGCNFQTPGRRSSAEPVLLMSLAIWSSPSEVGLIGWEGRRTSPENPQPECRQLLHMRARSPRLSSHEGTGRQFCTPWSRVRANSSTHVAQKQGEVAERPLLARCAIEKAGADPNASQSGKEKHRGTEERSPEDRGDSRRVPKLDRAPSTPIRAYFTRPLGSRS